MFSNHTIVELEGSQEAIESYSLLRAGIRVRADLTDKYLSSSQADAFWELELKIQTSVARLTRQCFACCYVSWHSKRPASSQRAYIGDATSLKCCDLLQGQVQWQAKSSLYRTSFSGSGIFSWEKRQGAQGRSLEKLLLLVLVCNLQKSLGNVVLLHAGWDVSRKLESDMKLFQTLNRNRDRVAFQMLLDCNGQHLNPTTSGIPSISEGLRKMFVATFDNTGLNRCMEGERIQLSQKACSLPTEGSGFSVC